MSKKAKGIFAVIFSLIISLITVFMINEYLNTETQRRVEQASADTHSVVVFASDLTAGTIVLAKDLLVRQYPSHLINHNWFLQNEAGLIIGQELRVDGSKGEPVSKRGLLNQQNTGLSRQLPDGHYAITVSTDNLGLHNALLKPGDVVDIAFVGEHFESGIATESFENIEVFDIHGLNDGYGSYALTLLIKPDDVDEFTRAMGSGMLVWARSSSSSREDVWNTESLTSKVMSWTAY